MSLPLSIMSAISAMSWTFYGILLRDIFVKARFLRLCDMENLYIIDHTCISTIRFPILLVSFCLLFN